MADEKKDDKEISEGEPAEEVKKYVLVTGASRGIGKEFCVRLAQRGYSIVLVARTGEDLKKNADSLKDKYGVDAIAIQADLNKQGVARSINEGLRKRGISLFGLVNNAGFGRIGGFDELSMGEYKEMIQLNEIALVEFTYEFLYDIRKNDGFIINVASVAGLVPTPFMAIYGATKAFVVQFTESLYAEYGNKPRMLVLSPGSTQSDFHKVASKNSHSVRQRMMPADDVVLSALRRIHGGSTMAVPGIGNKFAVCFSRIMPRRLVAKAAGSAIRSRMGK